jgi:hypothetical protein
MTFLIRPGTPLHEELHARALDAWRDAALPVHLRWDELAHSHLATAA